MPLRACQPTTPLRQLTWPGALATALVATGCASAHAQSQGPVDNEVRPPAGWQACAAETRDDARLACYDTWARRSAPAAPPTPSSATTAASAPPATTATAPPAPGTHATPVPSAIAAPTAVTSSAPGGPGLVSGAQPGVAKPRDEPASTTSSAGCHDSGYSELSRYWELERATGCGVFGIRSYRPISLSVIASNSVNQQPTSENPLNDASAPLPYRTTETRIQLSVRTKLAEGLLTQGALRDSLWFGYTQSSTWQVFTGALSRPFRNTDHEPEIVYAYPLQLPSVQGWRLRYGGVGLVHQSNGQSLPLSRSWNRVYLMGGAEHGGLSLQGRVWQRLNEDAPTDDNPGISNFVGRAEATGSWRMTDGETLSLTVRHSLRTEARGSMRLEWMLPIGGEHGASAPSSMRLHAQLFSGYGDSLLDYNRRRTVLSVGLSLVDW